MLERSDSLLNGLKKAGGFLRNCVEIYIPIAAFIVLFLTFCYQIFMRRVMGDPQSWTAEVQSICFLWLVMLGACYAQRTRGHVTFTLLYDTLGVKGKALLSMLGNLLIAVTFAAATIPSLNYVWGLQARAQVTSILKISKTLAFFPFVIFLVFILGYALMDIYASIQVLRGDEAYTRRLLEQSKSEAEIAIEQSLAQEPVDLTGIDYAPPGREEK